jgi:hypothetical protein
LAIELVHRRCALESAECIDWTICKASQKKTSLVRTELPGPWAVRKLKRFPQAYLIELIQQNLTVNDRKLAVTVLGKPGPSRR